MIGWVPHVMAEFFEAAGGRAVRDAILNDAGFAPEVPFRLDAAYADAACRAMVDAACARMGVGEAQAFALFAPFFLGHARASFPGFFAHVRSARDFLLHQPEVHNTLSAGLTDDERGRVAAKFRVEAAGPSGVRVFYRSPNRLAGLYAAVAAQLAEEMGERAVVTFERGGPGEADCVLRVDLLPADAAAAETERRPEPATA